MDVNPIESEDSNSVQRQYELLPGNRNGIMTEKTYRLVRSNKNGFLLSVGGYLFTKNKMINGKYYWECSKRKHTKASKNIVDYCSAKAVTQILDYGEHKLLKVSCHSHSANACDPIVKTVRSEIKNKAHETRNKPCQLIQDINVNKDVSVQPAMPNKKAVRKVIARARRHELPKEPQQLLDVNIPEHLRKTVSGEMFLLKEIQFGEDFILIFSTRTNICRLSKSELWLGDGTFKTVPEIFLQLYMIQAQIGSVNEVIVPMVYALMSSKKAELYDQLFIHLNELAYDFECELAPKFILTDYEIGAINAFKREFPTAKMKGCYFHLGKSIYRKIQDYGLASRYGTDVKFSLEVRMVYALAFLPPSEIPNAFLDFKAYYVLGRIQRKRKRTRRNSIEIRTPPLWSVHVNNENGFSRTSNPVESWNRRWNTLVGAAHVGTHFLIDELVKEEHKVNGDIERTIAGIPSAPKKKDFIKREERISLVLSKWNNTNTMETLRGLAYNLSF